MATRSRTSLFVTMRPLLMSPQENISLDVPPWLERFQQTKDDLESLGTLIDLFQGNANTSSRYIFDGDLAKHHQEIINEQSFTISKKINSFKDDIELIIRPDVKDHPAERKMRRNAGKVLLDSLQPLANRFCKLEKNYVNRLKVQSSDHLDVSDHLESFDNSQFDEELGLTRVVDNWEAVIDDREKRISELTKSITALYELFKDLQSLVIEQGEMIDRIDYNITLVVEYTGEAKKEITTGSTYQKKAGKKLKYLAGCLIIVLLLMIVAIIIKSKK